MSPGKLGFAVDRLTRPVQNADDAATTLFSQHAMEGRAPNTAPRPRVRRRRAYDHRGAATTTPHEARMRRTISTSPEFRRHWAGSVNFLPRRPDRAVRVRVPAGRADRRRAPDDGLVRITPGTAGPRLEQATHASRSGAVPPIERAVRSAFGLAHFRLSQIQRAGKCLHSFRERVLDPWQEALRREGFTWDRCYPIVFISGPGCATNYHMDFSHVLAWQVYGTKRFCGLRDPNRSAHTGRTA